MRFPFLLTALLVATTAHAASYRIDGAGSHARFGVRLFWLHTIEGRFDRIAGEVRVDERGMARVDARIDVNSVTMSSDRMRGWVLAPEFFDAARYPTIHFLSEPLPVTSLGRGGTLAGLVSLRGVTRPARFELAPSDCVLGSARPCRIEASGELSRGEYGMTARSPALADTVQLGLSIQVEPMAP